MSPESHGNAIGIPQHPLHNIPLDIVGEIFQVYMVLPRPAELDNLSEHSRDSYVLSSPYVLCLVCKSWQAIATDLPILWSNVVVYARWDPFGKAYTVRENHGRALREWVDRIRGHPWSLDLSATKRNWGDPSSHTPLIDILSPTIIANLWFLKAPGSVFKNRGGFGGTSFSKLKSLVLNEDSASLSTAVCPELKKAVLVSAGEFDLPWQLLTHLYIGNTVPFNVNDFIYVVTTGRRLQHLCISTNSGSMSLLSFPSFGDLSLSSQPPKTVPSMKLTDLTLISGAPFDTPLPTVSWPNLKRLRLLRDCNTWVAGWHDSNLRLLQSLTHLHLSSWELSFIPGPFLDACHSLTHLHVDVFENDTFFQDTFFQLFRSLDCGSAYQGLVVPHLQSLKIDCRIGRYYSRSPFPHDLLYTMVASRVAISPATGSPWTPLKYLAFRIYHPDRGTPCTLPGELREGLEEFTSRNQIDLSICVTQRDDGYEVQMSYADVDHWDRGFGAFIETLGEFDS